MLKTTIGGKSTNLISIIDEIRNIKSSSKELREFGITIGAVLILFAGLALWRGRASFPYLLACGILFIISGLLLPAVLKPLQKVWMGFAVVMGFVMSRVILTLLFFGIVTPIAVMMKVLGKDLLGERIVKAQPSYWHKRALAPEKPKESYENQY